MTKPKDLTYEEFVEFMEQTKIEAEKKYPAKLLDTDLKTEFTSIEEFEKYYNVICFDKYLEQSKEKSGC